jgi:hypothetical protein
VEREEEWGALNRCVCYNTLALTHQAPQPEGQAEVTGVARPQPWEKGAQGFLKLQVLVFLSPRAF